MKKNQFISRTLIAVVLCFSFVECLSQTSRPAAEIKFRELHFGKPPLVNLFFDVVLRNDRTEPRWFLLPGTLGSGAVSIGDKGGVDTLEVFVPQGKGRVPLGHFLGTGGFNALLLPPGAGVRLRLFPISFWGELPDHLQIEVVVARRLMIGDEKAEAWFGVDPASDVKADIAESAETPARILLSRHAPGNKEVAVVIGEDRRLQLQVSLKPKE